MALYRALVADDVRQGDLIVWEYALNDFNHISRGYKKDVLLRNIEHFIILCREKGCRLVAAIFTPRRLEAAAERNPFYQSILDLFAAYGVSCFDISAEFRLANSVRRMPEVLFSNGAHYEIEPELMRFIALGVHALCDDATLPAAIAPIRTGDQRLFLATDFCDFEFENSLLSVPAARLPVVLQKLPAGQILAIYCVCNYFDNNGVRVILHRADGDKLSFRFSASSEGNFQKPVLKAVSVENASALIWTVKDGDRLVLAAAVGPGVYYAEHRVRRHLKNLEREPDIWISGVLMSVPAAWHLQTVCSKR